MPYKGWTEKHRSRHPPWVPLFKYYGTCNPPPPKGAKVYTASRRRYNKRVGLKGLLAPHCVP